MYHRRVVVSTAVEVAIYVNELPVQGAMEGLGLTRLETTNYFLDALFQRDLPCINQCLLCPNIRQGLFLFAQ